MLILLGWLFTIQGIDERLSNVEKFQFAYELCNIRDNRDRPSEYIYYLQILNP